MEGLQNMAETVAVAFYVVTFVVIAAALILNLLGIYLLATAKSVLNNQSIILLHLSCIKIIVSLTEVVLSTLEIVGRADGHKEYEIFDTINAGLYGVNDLILIVLTTDRLIASKIPFSYNVHATTMKLNISVVCCWFIGTIGILPLFFLEYELLYDVYYKFVFLTLDGIVLLTAFLTYGTILRQLLTRKNGLTRTSHFDNRVSTSSTRHWRFFYTSGLIIASFILFVAVPDAVYVTLVIVKGVEDPRIERAVGFVWSIYLIADPLIYIFLQRPIRNRLRRIKMLHRVESFEIKRSEKTWTLP